MVDQSTTDTCTPVDQMAQEALHAARNKKVMAKLVTRLTDRSKAERATAAKLLHDAACIDPERLESHVDHLVRALEHPEPQTRWEVLGALEEIALSRPRLLDKAVAPTTHCLHDEDSSVVRLAAFRLLATFGASSIRRAEVIWPLLDEALRCYHGDSEYPGMLAALATFVDGRAPAAVKKEAAALVEPDASHPKAAISRGARRVFAIATEGRVPKRRVPGGMVAVEEKKPARKSAAKKPAARENPLKSAAVKKTPAKKATGKKDTRG